jgi:hypothetical protein
MHAQASHCEFEDELQMEQEIMNDAALLTLEKRQLLLRRGREASPSAQNITHGTLPDHSVDMPKTGRRLQERASHRLGNGWKA